MHKTLRGSCPPFDSSSRFSRASGFPVAGGLTTHAIVPCDRDGRLQAAIVRMIALYPTAEAGWAVVEPAGPRRSLVGHVWCSPSVSGPIVQPMPRVRHAFERNLPIYEVMFQRRRTPSESRAVTTPERQLDGNAEVLACLPVGAVLENKYRLDRVLGTGAMGTVFAATHLRNGNRVAVKVLHRALGAVSHVRSRFLREGYATNCVRHTGTVRVLDDGIAPNGALFLVMELLEGETVQALWERGGRLPPRQVAKLMWQALDILSAAHEGGIVHRDVKPENLFVECDGTLRVLDFGVARILQGTLAESRAGSVIGTLPYMAPEQMLGRTREVDARSDVWSVGATAFTLISGTFVHDAETPEEMLVFTASRQALSLAQVAPRAPRAIVAVVDRALRFERSERWPSARAMQAGFAEACRCVETTGEPVEDESGDRATPELEAPREWPRLEPPQSPSAASLIRSRPSVALATRREARWVPAAAVVVAVAVATVAALTAYGSGARNLPAAPAMNTSAKQ